MIGYLIHDIVRISRHSQNFGHSNLSLSIAQTLKFITNNYLERTRLYLFNDNIVRISKHSKLSEKFMHLVRNTLIRAGIVRKYWDIEVLQEKFTRLRNCRIEFCQSSFFYSSLFLIITDKSIHLRIFSFGIHL